MIILRFSYDKTTTRDIFSRTFVVREKERRSFLLLTATASWACHPTTTGVRGELTPEYERARSYSARLLRRSSPSRVFLSRPRRGGVYARGASHPSSSDGRDGETTRRRGDARGRSTRILREPRRLKNVKNTLHLLSPPKGSKVSPFSKLPLSRSSTSRRARPCAP